MQDKTRRRLLKSSIGSVGFLATGTWKSLACALDDERISQSDQEVERLAERIIDSQPEKVVELVAAEVRRGVSREDLLAACFNSGARFHGHHSAYVAHPVQVVSTSLDAEAALLPIFYYLSVLRFRARRNALRWLDKSKVDRIKGSDKKITDSFHKAMKQGERDDAGLSLLALSREIGPQAAYGNLWKYAAERNHNSGGHTAVSVVNTFRALQATNWRCVETAIQFAATDESWRLPGGSDVPSQNWERSERVSELPRRALEGASSEPDARELVSLYRRGNSQEACRETWQRLKAGKLSAKSVWDAVFLTTAELVVRYQWVGSKRLAGHSITCANALHFIFRNSGDNTIRLYQMLEAIEWTTSFLARERARPALREFDLLKLEPRQADEYSLDEVFGLLPPRRFASMHRPDFEDVDEAMKLAYGWLLSEKDPGPFIQKALWLMCIKSTPEVHDFKYPMALFENASHVSEFWRKRILAAAVHVLHGTDMEDSPIVQQAREVLG